MPNTLDLGSGHTVDLRQVLPQGAIERAAALEHWVVENAKSARAFLGRVNLIAPLVRPLQALAIAELPRAPKGRPGAGVPPTAWAELLQPALQGRDLGLLSEAGLPAVADPGHELVAAAHALGIGVEPWSGPSSLMMALAASGLGGQQFAFVGYLPVDDAARTARIRELEALSRRLAQTQIAIETPYRNAALAQALLAQLQPATRLSITCGLSLPGGWCHSARIADWRRQPPQFAEGLPAVFAWSAA
ncbi:MAG: SAM-dependent methyltransferase [Rubrivivax sp.]|nr:SAM-dependent methyltransferase [Rubrivivax sp.]